MTKTSIFRKLSVQDLVTMALFVAISLVLQRFSFGTNTTKFGFGFIATVILGQYFGPVWGGIGAGVADLASAAVFGVAGGFFPGFTLSAIMGGVIYGLFFYNQKPAIWRVIVATLLVTLIVNVVMNTTWITLMYHLDFKGALLQRLPKELIAPWLQMIITWLVLNIFERVKIRR